MFCKCIFKKFYQKPVIVERKESLLTLVLFFFFTLLTLCSPNVRIYMLGFCFFPSSKEDGHVCPILDRKIEFPDAEHFLYWQLVFSTCQCHIVRASGHLPSRRTVVSTQILPVRCWASKPEWPFLFACKLSATSDAG